MICPCIGVQLTRPCIGVQLTLPCIGVHCSVDSSLYTVGVQLTCPCMGVQLTCPCTKYTVHSVYSRGLFCPLVLQSSALSVCLSILIL